MERGAHLPDLSSDNILVTDADTDRRWSDVHTNKAAYESDPIPFPITLLNSTLLSTDPQTNSVWNNVHSKYISHDGGDDLCPDRSSYAGGVCARV